MNTLINQSEQEEPLFEFWDEEPIEPKPHSCLYHLEPMGVGTPFVESLTSYITRLAAAHSVLPSRLIMDEVVPLLGKRYLRSDRPGKTRLAPHFVVKSSRLNGPTTTAHSMIQALEYLTLCHDLRFLTFVPWEDVLPIRNLLRQCTAWCPICLEDWREGRQPVYFPLLWAVEAVDVCPHHLVRLKTQCPYTTCGKASTPLSRHAQPGYCSHCYRWLGCPLNREQEQSSTLEEGLLKRQQWIATSIGELLTVATQRETMPSFGQVSTKLAAYVDEFAGGSKPTFIRLTQCSNTGLSSWLQKEQKPQLQAWLQICFHLGVSLADSLTIPQERSIGPSRTLENRAYIKQLREPGQRFSWERIQSILEDALKEGEGEPPSVREIAYRVGCSLRDLYMRFPALARAITARQKDYHKAIRQKQVPREKIWSNKPRKQGQRLDWDKLQQTLEAILADTESIPTSMQTVASQLGYFPEVLAKKLPDLCRSISARYAEYRKQRKEARIQMLGQQLRQTMLSLYEQGCYPGIQRVRNQLNDAWLCRDPYTKAVWRETLSELKARDKRL